MLDGGAWGACFNKNMVIFQFFNGCFGGILGMRLTFYRQYISELLM